MKLYNTLTRKIESFTPLHPPAVTMYVCGPTVYDVPHIGHARSAYVFDVLRRYLTFRGYQVNFVRNVTDVDDKIIEKARQEIAHSTQHTAHSDLKAKCAEVSQRYLASYRETLRRFGIEPPTKEPLATAHVVPEMTDLISTLLIKGVAYEAKGDVYFSVRKCEGYGKLSNRTLDELQAGARIEPGEHPGPPVATAGAGKHDPLDFALWKAAKLGEPSWQSPWGAGRPGWHIECSAMSTKYLGDQFDIHGGGVDLVFPHHENEVAQAVAAGKPFARYWVHNGLLTVNGEKMSKSLGNYTTVEDALNNCQGNAEALKIFFLGAHYRSPIDYSAPSVQAAAARWRGLAEALHRVEAWRTNSTLSPLETCEARAQFERAMDDDLNTPAALAVLDRLAVDLSRTVEAEAVKHADALLSLCRVLGLFLSYQPQPVELPTQWRTRLDAREAARKRKDFQSADQIRREFQEAGFILEDTAHGPVVWRRP